MDDEKAWVAQAQQGSDEAFTQLVVAYQTHVYNLCFRMLGEPEAAEDAAQETFLRAYQYLTSYDSLRPFATWLLSIAAHYCIDRLRRDRFSSFSIGHEEEGSFDLLDPAAPNPESEVIYSEQRRQIQDLLAGLDAVNRAAVVMYYWHGCSDAEIARSLNLTVSAVKSRLHRVRREMAVLWQAQIPRPNMEGGSINHESFEDCLLNGQFQIG